MNDFLRPCNCVHPSDEECDNCVAEAATDAPPKDRCEACEEAKQPDVSNPQA